MTGRDISEQTLALSAWRCTSSPHEAAPGFAIGELVGLLNDGLTAVLAFDLEGQPTTTLASTMADLRGEHIGRRVAALFEGGDPAKAVVIGVMRDAATHVKAAGERVEVSADGEQFVLRARSRLVLRCGDASITLTRDGKIVVQGECVVHRARGAVRIKGAVVEIN
ncbi:DUF6484 domain-containing protein [Caballeronia sp. TF1N1]|uniref:DUF6484 domain-containing protein n=1 Tax=Caballeronia sp. TF1N1 TaxID=2878153 RepID=UPI001FD05AF5|nr:DUF6484 domain-containing protein [Caballeronia sp. TF1N1]